MQIRQIKNAAMVALNIISGAQHRWLT